MAGTFNGIGTKFYGQRDFRADATYITTEWFVFCFIPLIPLRSLRVRFQGPANVRSYVVFFSSRRSYAVFETGWPNWKQVLCTYGFVALSVCWSSLIFLAIAVSQESRGLGSKPGVLPILFACLFVPVLLPWFLRHRAKKRLLRSMQSALVDDGRIRLS
jgi:hypothetical protein